MPDEDLFYDPSLDDEDEKWVNNKRKNYLKSGIYLKFQRFESDVPYQQLPTVSTV